MSPVLFVCADQLRDLTRPHCGAQSFTGDGKTSSQMYIIHTFICLVVQIFIYVFTHFCATLVSLIHYYIFLYFEFYFIFFNNFILIKGSVFLFIMLVL